MDFPQQYLGKLLRAVVEFDMIADGDNILVGVSGGKDSMFLLLALAHLRRRIQRRFSLTALTVDPMFTDDFSVKPIAEMCRESDVPFDSFPTDIGGSLAKSRKNPCFTCAFLRRGAVNRYATEHGFNKVAYAHHNDDAVETLLMSLLYSGQITVFSPVTYLSRTNLTVIRPLIYFRESEIIKATRKLGINIVPSPCPLDGTTHRQRVKELIAELDAEDNQVYAHLAAALRENAVGELWAKAKTRDEMRELYVDYMQPKKITPEEK